MDGFFQQLMARPSEPPTRLSRYTEWCGYAYSAMGTLIFLWPDSQVALGFSPPFQGQEQGLVRTLGFVLLLIGYFYVFGGRTHRNCFGLATVLDRLLVPFFFAIIYFTSEISLFLVLPIAVLDPLLAAGAYFCWRADQADLKSDGVMPR